MSTVEANIKTAIGSLVSGRVFPDVAPATVTLPYVVYQAVGGTPAWFFEKTTASKKNVDVQIKVWSNTRAEASSISRAIEDAMVAATAFDAMQSGGLVAQYDADFKLYGAVQTYSVWFDD